MFAFVSVNVVACEIRALPLTWSNLFMDFTNADTGSGPIPVRFDTLKKLYVKLEYRISRKKCL